MTTVKHQIYAQVEEFLFQCLDLFLRDVLQLEISRLGSEYGGWWIPNRYVAFSSPKIVCISAGIGTDFSFDQAMIQLGHSLVGVDPIGRYCDKYMESLGHTGRVLVINKALAESKDVAVISPPKNPVSASWSIRKDNRDSDSDLVVPAQSLNDVIQDSRSYFPNTDIAILKMDIEGAEEQILTAMIQSQIKIEWVCVEFDFVALISLKRPVAKLKALVRAVSIVKKLREVGYGYVLREKSNLYFNYTQGV